MIPEIIHTYSIVDMQTPALPPPPFLYYFVHLFLFAFFVSSLKLYPKFQLLLKVQLKLESKLDGSGFPVITL